MTRLLTALFLVAFAFDFAAGEEAELKILVVVGVGGTDEYEEIFNETAGTWEKAAARGGAAFQGIGLDEDSDNDAERLREAIASTEAGELWLVLIGHGSFDGRTAKFNARGPDFTGVELASWLEDYRGDLSVINTASASGSFIQDLAEPGRIVITATKNEGEVFFTRFGTYFAEAVAGLPNADLDNDDQVSLLECFLFASKRVEEFYEKEGRLATEHALLDDNGDGLASRSEWFEGVTPTRAPAEEAEFDGERAAQKVLVMNAFERQLTNDQRQRRDALELKVKDLRRARSNLDDSEYYSKLEELLLELATIYREADKS
ncbi:MAG: hypothetical protein WD342_13655 [Verrucomicrobiales bacterium]